MIRFALKAEVRNIGTQTRYSSVLAHAAVLRASKIDWAQSDCPSCHHYACRTAHMREVPPTQHGGRNFPGSKPRARESLKVSDLFDIKATFKEDDKKTEERLAKTLATPGDKAPRVNLTVGEGG